MFTAMGQLASVVFSLGYLFLLGGLAAGLPSLDEGDDEGKTHETEAAGLADFNGSNDSPV